MKKPKEDLKIIFSDLPNGILIFRQKFLNNCLIKTISMHRLSNILSLLFLFSISAIVGCKNVTHKDPRSGQTTSIQRTVIEDQKSAKLVDQMVTAMGGYDNWDQLAFVSWTFFGARHLVWDKKNGRVRIDSPRDTTVYLVDLHNGTGRVSIGGKEVTDLKKLKKALKKGESIWINDSYWLFMPFKLQDSGVSVQYMREDTIPGGLPASVLALTFDNVGNTPENKYEIYIDQNDHLIKQWAFYQTADQENPPKIWPWDNYKTYGNMKLSSERSDKSGPSNVRVYQSLEDSVFTSFVPFDYF